MDAQIVYDATGDVVSVTLSDPESGGRLEALPGEGQSVLTVDESTVTRLSAREGDEGAVAVAILTGYRVDAANSRLVQK